MKVDNTVLNISAEALNILGENSIISQRLQNYEFRPQQLDMAKAISKAIETSRHLIVEAGTGVGKSLAYLIPFIIYAIEYDKKVIISTYTKTLQNQLYLKDLPFLRESLDKEFDYALCLGSENYLCLGRLNSEYTHDLFDKDVSLKEMKRIAEWSSTIESGIKSDLGFIPKDEVWTNICRDPDLCVGKKCHYRNECFYRKAKRQEKKSHILVTNHSLFFTNLASGGQVLPDFHAIVFDEAQTLEDVATSYLGFEISNTKMRYLFDSIYNTKTHKGLLAKFISKDVEGIEDIQFNLAESKEASRRLFHELGEIFGRENDTKRIRSRNIVFNHLEEPLKRLIVSLSRLLDHIDGEQDKLTIRSHIKRCIGTSSSLSFILNHEREDYVYWIEVAKRRKEVRYSLYAAPIEIAEELHNRLFSKIRPIVLTSATLSTNNSFELIRRRLGVVDCDEMLLDSPFDYERNVILYLPKGIEDPNENFEVYQKQALEQIKKIIDIMQGRIFVLFTNYKMLNSVYEDLALSYRGLNLLRQGEKPRYELLTNFKKNENSVLLGTNTFWQGVDLPGKSLECVIITKLPFLVPDDPITEARMESIESSGKDPFVEYQVPQAIMMFKQGFGRLIRTKSDRGIVAILDPRIRTRYYGRSFISALPKCKYTFDIGEIRRFFRNFEEDS